MMISISIPGNIEIQIEKYEPLFDLIYAMSSDNISAMLDMVACRLKDNEESKTNRSISESTMLLLNQEYFNLKQLSNAFKELNETPIVNLIAE